MTVILTRCNEDEIVKEFAPQKRAEFSDTAEDTPITRNVEVLAEQSYTDNSFALSPFPMVAVSENASLAFKNMCGLLKFQLKGKGGVKSVCLTGNNDEILAKTAGNGKPTKVSAGYTLSDKQNAEGYWVLEGVVSKIPAGPFFYKNITEVKLPASVRAIRSNAFYKTSLTAITLPEGLETIGNEAFYSTKLTKVTLPASVTSIGDGAFKECSQLQTLTFTENCRLTTISAHFINNCYNLQQVTIPNGVTKIGRSAFSGTSSLTAITIPGSVTTIENEAFYSTSISELTLPESVETLEHAIVSWCNTLQKIVIQGVKGNRTFDSDAFIDISSKLPVDLVINLTWKEDIVLENGKLYFHSINTRHGTRNHNFRSIKDPQGYGLRP